MTGGQAVVAEVVLAAAPASREENVGLCAGVDNRSYVRVDGVGDRCVAPSAAAAVVAVVVEEERLRAGREADHASELADTPLSSAH